MARKRGRPKFTVQLSTAIAKLRQQEQKLLATDNNQLYSLIFKGGTYQWITLVATDGLLVTKWHTSASSGPSRQILVGVVIQSEQRTSETKPNPLGKAAAAMTPLGLWVDIKGQAGTERQRLDVVHVLLIVPEPTDAARKKKYPMILQNVENVVDTVEQAHLLGMPQGANVEAIAQELMKKCRPWLFGRGRPAKK